MSNKTLSLKKAMKTGKLDRFIAEHEADASGDMDKLDAAIRHPSAETKKSDQAASKPDSGDD